MQSDKAQFAAEYVEGLIRCLKVLPLEAIARLLGYLEQAQREGRAVFIIGNGGSAATASHMACDLAKNTFDPREGEPTQRLRVMSLTDNVSWITALGNDIGYEYIFSEQLRNLVRPGDLVIAITGSGNSPNIIHGVEVARSLGATVVGLLGFKGGKVLELLDDYVLVASDNYGHIEDIHLVINHILVAYLKSASQTSALAVAIPRPAAVIAE